MPLEIEAKMKVEDRESMAARLRSHGAVPVGKYLETNTFFDTKDRALLAADEGLRLRVSRNLLSGESSIVLTHKGPNQIGPLKTREETELSVADADNAARLLEHLGFVRCLSFQKRRQSWKLEGCKIELDEVPHLGCFVEIEGPGEETILRLREELGLAGHPLIKASYVAMLTSYLRERGEACAEINFPEPPDTVARAG
jgi:adenylate cyclase, class 2